jgi:hypothetical protein
VPWTYGDRTLLLDAPGSPINGTARRNRWKGRRCNGATGADVDPAQHDAG